MHDVDRLLRNTVEQRIAKLIAAYVEAEDNLPTRHHGRKHRRDELIGAIQDHVDVPADMMGRWLDWAVTTWEMRVGDLLPGRIGETLAETLIDRWT